MLKAFQEFRIGDVLACENHPFVQLGLKASLKETLPHLPSLRLAGSGKEALRLAQEKRPDLVIVDLGLPDMSCLELIQRLREIWTDLRSTEFVVRLNNDPHGPCWHGAVDAEDGVVLAVKRRWSLSKPTTQQTRLTTPRSLSSVGVDGNRLNDEGVWSLTKT